MNSGDWRIGGFWYDRWAVDRSYVAKIGHINKIWFLV